MEMIYFGEHDPSAPVYAHGGGIAIGTVMGVRRNFFRGGQSRHFAYLFQIVDDATQMDI